jgi:hypothetical protein
MEDLKDISQKLLDCEAMMTQLPPSAFKALVVRAQHALLANAKLIKRTLFPINQYPTFSSSIELTGIIIIFGFTALGLMSEPHLPAADRALLIQELNIGLTHVVRIYQEAGAVPPSAAVIRRIVKS